MRNKLLTLAAAAEAIQAQDELLKYGLYNGDKRSQEERPSDFQMMSQSLNAPTSSVELCLVSTHSCSTEDDNRSLIAVQAEQFPRQGVHAPTVTPIPPQVQQRKQRSLLDIILPFLNLETQQVPVTCPTTSCKRQPASTTVNTSNDLNGPSNDSLAHSHPSSPARTCQTPLRSSQDPPIHAHRTDRTATDSLIPYNHVLHASHLTGVAIDSQASSPDDAWGTAAAPHTSSPPASPARPSDQPPHPSTASTRPETGPPTTDCARAAAAPSAFPSFPAGVIPPGFEGSLQYSGNSLLFTLRHHQPQPRLPHPYHHQQHDPGREGDSLKGSALRTASQRPTTPPDQPDLIRPLRSTSAIASHILESAPERGTATRQPPAHYRPGGSATPPPNADHAVLTWRPTTAGRTTTTTSDAAPTPSAPSYCAPPASSKPAAGPSSAPSISTKHPQGIRIHISNTSTSGMANPPSVPARSAITLPPQTAPRPPPPLAAPAPGDSIPVGCEVGPAPRHRPAAGHAAGPRAPSRGVQLTTAAAASVRRLANGQQVPQQQHTVPSGPVVPATTAASRSGLGTADVHMTAAGAEHENNDDLQCMEVEEEVVGGDAVVAGKNATWHHHHQQQHQLQQQLYAYMVRQRMVAVHSATGRITGAGAAASGGWDDVRGPMEVTYDAPNTAAFPPSQHAAKGPRDVPVGWTLRPVPPSRLPPPRPPHLQHAPVPPSVTVPIPSETRPEYAHRGASFAGKGGVLRGPYPAPYGYAQPLPAHLRPVPSFHHHHHPYMRSAAPPPPPGAVPCWGPTAGGQPTRVVRLRQAPPHFRLIPASYTTADGNVEDSPHVEAAAHAAAPADGARVVALANGATLHLPLRVRLPPGVSPGQSGMRVRAPPGAVWGVPGHMQAQGRAQPL